MSSKIERRYDALVEFLDCKTSQWWAFPSFLISIGIVWWIAGYDYANFWVSIFTVAFFFVLQYGSRKDRIANQLKHDAEVEAIPEAANEIKGIEKETLSELEDRASEV